MMPESISPVSGTCDQPTCYEIRIKGHLGRRWAEWFVGLTMTHTASGETTLSGPIEDQAALHGVLNKIRDLNLTLIAVNEIPCPAKRTATGTVE
jgi:hypothetical protein